MNVWIRRAGFASLCILLLVLLALSFLWGMSIGTVKLPLDEIWLSMSYRFLGKTRVFRQLCREEGWP